MNEFVLKAKDGGLIRDWRSWTPPKQPYQWQGGRGAMELARSWFVSPVPVCPREIADLLASHPRTADVTLLEGIPEHVTTLPERGEGRNHDLLLHGRGATGRVVISVEAKVDEPFGEAIGSYWDKARTSGAPTKAPERMKALLAMLFGAKARPDADPWRALRYQLLTAVAGTAIEAARRDADLVVVIVHEFRTENINEARWSANAADFRAFVGVLCGLGSDEVMEGRLYGPATLAVSEYLPRQADVLIGKAVFDWSAVTTQSATMSHSATVRDGPPSLIDEIIASLPTIVDALRARGVHERTDEREWTKIIATALSDCGLRNQVFQQYPQSRTQNDIQIEDDSGAVVAVIEATKNWNTYAAFREDVEKLLTLPANVEKYVLLCCGFPTNAPRIRDEDTLKATARGWLQDVSDEAKRAGVRLVAQDSWCSGCWHSGINAKHPDYCVLVGRVEKYPL